MLTKLAMRLYACYVIFVPFFSSDRWINGWINNEFFERMFDFSKLTVSLVCFNQKKKIAVKIAGEKLYTVSFKKP